MNGARANIDISIIIPVYKVERYIERCVRCLMEQTKKDGIEFLFVNDCTPDASMEIIDSVLKEYPHRAEQVRIINNNDNKGVSATRKIGLSVAQGAYIGWCDADDCCEKDMFQQMWSKTEDGKIDMVICNYSEDDDLNSTAVKWNHCVHPRDCFINMREGFYFPGSLWQQICRKEIIAKSLNLIVNVNYAEDIYSIILETFFAESIAYTDTVLYHHTSDNLSSLLHNVGYKKSDWNAQKANLDLVSNYCTSSGNEKCITACNALKLSMKHKFRSAFSSTYDFYCEYSDCYRDINNIYHTPQRSRWKTFMIFNFYPLFWLFSRNNSGNKMNII